VLSPALLSAQLVALSSELLGQVDTAAGGTLSELNPAWEHVSGWTPEELDGQRLLSLVDSADANRVGELIARADNQPFDFRLTARDHSIRSVRAIARPSQQSGMVLLAARDITDELDRESSHHAADARWRTALRTAVDAMMMIDDSGVLLHFNFAAENMFGYSKNDVVGRNVAMLMPDPFHGEHDGYLRNYGETKVAKIIGIGREVVGLRRDGTTVPIWLSVSQVDNNGSVEYMGVCRNLTAEKEAARQLQEANESLESRVAERTRELTRSNRDLEQFAYIASHDLQAPLRNVRQGLELLDEHLRDVLAVPFDAEASELRRLIVGAVSRMEDLIQGLLAYSRVQRHGDAIDQPVALAAVLTEVEDLLASDLAQATATLSAGPLPTVSADARQVRQLLLNLVVNAVKYRSPDHGRCLSPRRSLDHRGER
jgi:two-component system, LuxR family, sensor kinase FixL